MDLKAGDLVEHPDYGPGTIVDRLGSNAVVEFFGEKVDVDIRELTTRMIYEPEVFIKKELDQPDHIAFRRSFEAVNLGVVPPDPDELTKWTIGGAELRIRIKSWLDNSQKTGFCKTVFGYYGTGKSHYLKFVRGLAQDAGWVVAFLEFDPKAADPAKPHLIYRGLMTNLSFPPRQDGTRSHGFIGMIREIRENWERVSENAWLEQSPWFNMGLRTLIHYPHDEKDQQYMDACAWLGAQNTHIYAMRQLARNMRINPREIPIMPRIKEASDIYVFHLVVIHHILRSLGYQGLLVVVDEAEHIRGYNVRRRARATNFFDLLSRAAHHLADLDCPPLLNDHGFSIPPYWERGPHFSLLVGLTPGNIFEDPAIPLREACVFLHDESDCIFLTRPEPDDFLEWCLGFLERFHSQYPERTVLIATEESRQTISRFIRDQYVAPFNSHFPIRFWIKLASLAPAILMTGRCLSFADLVEHLNQAIRGSTWYDLPWE